MGEIGHRELLVKKKKKKSLEKLELKIDQKRKVSVQTEQLNMGKIQRLISP